MPVLTIVNSGHRVLVDAVNLEDGVNQDVIDKHRGLSSTALAVNAVLMNASHVDTLIEYLQRFKENLFHVPRSVPAAAAAPDPHRAALADVISELAGSWTVGPSGAPRTAR